MNYESLPCQFQKYKTCGYEWKDNRYQWKDNIRMLHAYQKWFDLYKNKCNQCNIYYICVPCLILIDKEYRNTKYIDRQNKKKLKKLQDKERFIEEKKQAELMPEFEPIPLF